MEDYHDLLSVTTHDHDHDHDDKKKKSSLINVASGNKKSAGGGGSSMKCCQAEKCSADLNDAKQYHRRHRVCEHHAKAQVVVVGGIRQRFCQQCSRFHEVSEFDEAKRSCRRRLAGHNERRRKNSSDPNAEGSERKSGGGGGGGAASQTQIKEMVCGHEVDHERSRIHLIQENPTYNKHFQIR